MGLQYGRQIQVGNKIDLTGQVFGRLTVLHEENPRTTKRIKWTCQCKCGTIKNIYGNDLRQGKVLSCGCLRNERVREAVGNQLEGQRFGRLIILRQAESIREPSGILRTAWLCRCDCGKEIIAKTLNLKAGDTQSCGCLNLNNHKLKRKDLSGQRFGKLVALEIDEDYMNNFRSLTDARAYWKCKCDCGNYKTVSTNNLLQNHTMSCGCIKSQGEQIISSVLELLPYTVIKEYGFQNLKGQYQQLKFDFALFQDNQLQYLIEYNGEQHYRAIDFFGGEEKLKSQQEYDKLKEEYCIKHNIPLVIIPYTDRKKIDIKYIKEKLDEAKEIYGHFTSTSEI